MTQMTAGAERWLMSPKKHLVYRGETCILEPLPDLKLRHQEMCLARTAAGFFLWARWGRLWGLLRRWALEIHKR